MPNTRLLLDSTSGHQPADVFRATPLGHPHRRIFRDDEHDRQRRFWQQRRHVKTP